MGEEFRRKKERQLLVESELVSKQKQKEELEQQIKTLFLEYDTNREEMEHVDIHASFTIRCSDYVATGDPPEYEWSHLRCVRERKRNVKKIENRK